MAAWSRAFRQHPVLLIVPLLIEVLKWLLGELLGDEVFNLLHRWAEAHSRAAMVALQFIRDHWIWLPWGLVPITLIVAVVWGTANANRIMREKIIPVGQLEDEALSRCGSKTDHGKANSANRARV